MKEKLLILAATLSLALLCGCGGPTTQEVSKKAENIKTKQELERTLGKPTSFSKLGPLETWTYKTTDGEVTFIITGDSVQMQAAGSDGKKKD